MKEIDIQVQEAQRVPNNLDPRRTTPRHIIVKMPQVKDKERILKAAREKQRASYKGHMDKTRGGGGFSWGGVEGWGEKAHNCN